MSKIVEFPTQSVRNRAEIERTLREHLHAAGAGQGDVDAILASMSGFLALLDLDFRLSLPEPIPNGLPQQLNALGIALQERTKRLIFERVNVEVDHVAALNRRR